MRLRQLILFVCWLLMIPASSAQETVTLSLTTDTTALQTGSVYTVSLNIGQVSELWAGEVYIQYDPAQLYVLGTEAGSPVSVSTMLASGGRAIFNRADPASGQLHYAFSLFNPADPVSGSGTLGTFQVYPLQAGQTQLRFVRGQLSSVEFALDASGQRIGGSPVEIPFVPVLLDLTISGETVPPPAEGTATPTPSPTADLALLERPTEAVEPTLVNVTAAPQTPVPDTAPTETASAPQAEADSFPLLLGVGISLVVIALGGLLLLFRAGRKR